MKNLWTEKFSEILALSDCALAQRLTTPAVVTDGMHAMPSEVATEMLRSALAHVHVATDGEIVAIRRILGRALSHAIKAYPNPRTYLEAIYSRDLQLEAVNATCLTGTAGVGKSQTVRSMMRLIASARGTVNLPDGTAAPLLLGASVDVGQRNSPGKLINALYASLGADAADLRGGKVHADVLKRRCYGTGTCFVLVDEMQFLTVSASASTLVSKVLLSLIYLGIPLVYVANFSLLHKLTSRPQQESQRLISDVIHLDPDAPDSPAFLEMVNQWCVASDGAFVFDPRNVCEALDEFTGGSKRAMVDLLVKAYRRKRAGSTLRRSCAVTLSDIEAAYKSDDFKQFRNDAQILMNQRISSRPVDPRRTDLWGPIQSIGTTDTVMQEQAAWTRQEQVGRRRLISAMSPDELSAAKAVADVFSAPADQECQSIPLPKAARRPKASFESMRARTRT